MKREEYPNPYKSLRPIEKNNDGVVKKYDDRVKYSTISEMDNNDLKQGVDDMPIGKKIKKKVKASNDSVKKINEAAQAAKDTKVVKKKSNHNTNSVESMERVKKRKADKTAKAGKKAIDQMVITPLDDNEYMSSSQRVESSDAAGAIFNAGDLVGNIDESHQSANSNIEENDSTENTGDNISTGNDGGVISGDMKEGNTQGGRRTAKDMISTITTITKDIKDTTTESSLDGHLEGDLEVDSYYDYMSAFQRGIMAKSALFERIERFSVRGDDVFRMLLEYSNSIDSLKDLVTKHLSMEYSVFCNRILHKYSEVTDLYNYCRQKRSKAFKCAGLDPYRMQFVDMPAVAFKGGMKLNEYDENGAVIGVTGELSTSYVKFIADRNRVFTEQAQVIEDMKYSKNPVININQTNIQNNIGNLTLSELLDTDITALKR